ncbi:Hpt domain-containing protein, partial [Bradyrhizobium sp. SRS-191]|uniref:Hpt domain-containing protein n=1 Tax=Bradyrhizobium sp. SRS-191 TaxID=2962606 RepID=UPI00211EB13C
MSSEADSLPFEQFRKTYFEECAELLESLQANLDLMANGDRDSETLNAVFRSVHSIKGGAGAFSFSALIAFSHVFESLLDAMRDRRVAATPEITQLLMRASDALSDIVSAARTDNPLAANFGADIVAAMQAALPQGPGQPQSAQPVKAEADRPIEAAKLRYSIAFTPHTEMFVKANEPLLLIRQLRKLGDLKIEADTSRLPDFHSMEPEIAYLGWVFTLETTAPKDAIQGVFEFVEDDCNLRIERLDDNRVSSPIRSAAEPAVAA